MKTSQRYKKINNDIVYTCVEEKIGLISVLQTFYCVVNGKKYGPFSDQPEIRKNDNTFYINIKIDGKKGIIYNNKLYGPYYEFDDIYFSEDSSKFLLSYLDDEDNHILLENDTVVVSSLYLLGEICYSLSNELCYAYENDDEECFVNVGEKQYGPFSWVDEFYFDSYENWYIQVDVDEEFYVLCNGKLYTEDEFEMQYHIIGLSNVKKDSNGYYLTDGKVRSESFDEIDLKSLEDFEENDIPAFIAKKSNAYYIIKKITKKYGPYSKLSYIDVDYDKKTERLFYIDNDKSLYQDGLLVSNLLSYPGLWRSENWETYCYKEQRYNGQYLIANNEIIGPYDEIFGIDISKDGKKVVYEAKIKGEHYVFEGIKRFGPYIDVYSLTISPNNKLAFVYKDNDYNEFVYYDGNMYGPYEDVGTGVLGFSFSDDGEHIGTYVKKELLIKEKFLFVDGNISLSLPDIYSYEPIFSKTNNDILCVNYNPDWIYLNSKKINGKPSYTYPFKEYGIVAYTEETNNKRLKRLIINNSDYIGSFLWDDFIYIDNGNIMYIKN